VIRYLTVWAGPGEVLIQARAPEFHWMENKDREWATPQRHVFGFQTIYLSHITFLTVFAP